MELVQCTKKAESTRYKADKSDDEVEYGTMQPKKKTVRYDDAVEYKMTEPENEPNTAFKTPDKVERNQDDESVDLQVENGHLKI